MAIVQEIGVREVDHWFTKLPAFPAGVRIECDERVNWIIGENGAGKSALLEMMRTWKRKDTDGKHPLNLTIAGAVGTVLFFDAERDNPRIKSHLSQNSAVMMYEIAARMSRRSHGQVIGDILHSLITDADIKSGDIIFVDEPESGLSPWKQKALLDNWVQRLGDKGVQLFASTHSIVFMESGIGRVINLNVNPASSCPSDRFVVFEQGVKQHDTE